MNCEECEKLQILPVVPTTYRWDIANIEMVGCEKHLKEIFDVLSFYQMASREGKVGLLLHPESWQNIFKCLHQSHIKSEGNFWSAIQELERQFEEHKNLKT